MRLIDADALKENLFNYSAPEMAWDKEDLNHKIDEMPTVKPEPKKGKWIGGELGYCTCCGHEGCASDMWSRCEKPHCPNCGAEMEGVQT